MTTRKLCEAKHPKLGLLCDCPANHMGKHGSFDKKGARHHWKLNDDGPDSLKELFRF